MPGCEICGKRYDILSRALVEGVMIDVCDNCGKFGKVVSASRNLSEPTQKRFIAKINVSEENIIDNYSELIRKGREKKGLKQEELAKEIAEKESIIHKIETGSMKPSLTLARKLEQFLDIKLVEMLENEKEVGLNVKNSEMTIGDMLKIQKRKI